LVAASDAGRWYGEAQGDEMIEMMRASVLFLVFYLRVCAVAALALCVRDVIQNKGFVALMMEAFVVVSLAYVAAMYERMIKQ
jgi:hypothetical protein